MEEEINFFPLLVVTLLAVLVPVILQQFSRLGIPIVVGEILAGVVVGPAGLGLITESNAWLDFLKLFGFVYLMFLSGLEIDFGIFVQSNLDLKGSHWKRLMSRPLQAGLIFFFSTLFLSYLAGTWLVHVGLAQDVVMMTLVFSTTSLGIVMPVLKERGLTFTRLGQNILVASGVGDFLTIFLISAYVTIHTQGLTFDFLLVFLLLAATFIVYGLSRYSQRHLPLERLVAELSHATAQLDVRGSLALAVIFIALAQILGAEAILGAFLAGAIVSLLSEHEGSAVRPKLNALGYGFFIPIFFIMVGVGFDLPALLNAPNGLYLVPELILVALAVKVISAFVYWPVFSFREILSIGSLTSARLSLIIAISAIGLEIGAISETMNAAVIVLAIATVTLAPLLFNRLAPAREVKRDQVLLVGSPPHARLLAQRLRNHDEDVIVVSSNKDFLKEASGMGLNSIRVPPRGHLKALEQQDLSGVRALVSMLDDESMTLRITSLARCSGVENVVAYVQNPKLAEELKIQGIQVVEPSLSLVLALEAMIRSPQAFSLLAETHQERDIVAVKMQNSALDRRCLRDVRLPGDVVILVLDRAGESVIPRGFTELRRGDQLTLIGSRDSLRRAASLLSGSKG